MPDPITFDDLDTMATIMREEGADPTGRWAAYSGRVLGLPDWFDRSLAPDGDAYRQQQIRLWQAIAGVAEEFDAARDEQTPEVAGFDPLRYPGFYARRDPAAVSSAGDHLIAIGNMVKLCGLQPGDTALEYGAGFGQLALTLARLGVRVDAVDINPLFNAAVQQQAEFYKLQLHAVHGRFGDNPRPGTRYDAVIFYESLHHCPEPIAMIRTLRTLVKATGSVLLAGEPVVMQDHTVPYPWGIRLDAATVAFVRWRHWFEGGFQENFLVRAFLANGFVWTKHACDLTHHGDVHRFHLRPDRIELGRYAFPASKAAGWSEPEPTGRWTTGPATLPIDAGGDHTRIRISLQNHHAQRMTCRLVCGPVSELVSLHSSEHVMVTLPCARGSPALEFITDPIEAGPGDSRLLGIFVNWLEYAGPEASHGEADAPEPPRILIERSVVLAGQAVTITGDSSDPYFTDAQLHAADMADLVERVSTLPDGAVILDVGANIGLSAIAMALARPDARVIAFEPNPVTYRSLRQNVAAFSNIEAVQAAASDRRTVLHFHASQYAAGSHVVGAGHIQAEIPTVEVQAVTLDQVVAERGIEPCFIKIDVEGHEPEALAGAAWVVERFRPFIYMEFNAWTLNAFAGHSPAAVVQAIWDRFDVEGYPEPLAFLHENLVQNGCVSNITLRLKPDAKVPSLDMMSLSQTARDRIGSN